MLLPDWTATSETKDLLIQKKTHIARVPQGRFSTGGEIFQCIYCQIRKCHASHFYPECINVPRGYINCLLAVTDLKDDD